MTEQTKSIFAEHVVEWIDEVIHENPLTDKPFFIEIVFDDGTISYYNLMKNSDMFRRIFEKKMFL
jgi:hypothetical protein